MSLPPISEAEARRLASGGYGQTLLRLAGSYVVPIAWPKRVNHEGVHLTNGTAFFVQTPRALFGVTAAHVVNKYIADSSRDRSIVCGLLDSDTPLDLPSDLIAVGRNVDIATFRVHESTIAKLHKQPISVWPPRIPQEGKGVSYAGFPGDTRIRKNVREFEFGLCSGAGLADDVQAGRIVTSIDRPNLVDTLGLGLPPENFDFGGMSGGPLLMLIETEIVSWKLAGVIYQGSTLGGGILQAAHATCVNEDGTISG